MSLPGQQSTAHEYDKIGACIYCGMYKVNVAVMSHDCTPKRESQVDRDYTLEQEQKRVAELEGKDGEPNGG